MSNATAWHPSKSIRLYRRRRAAFIESRGGVCAQCGSSDRLEIDHVDPSTKLMNPGAALQARADIRIPELAKCQVLCWACHREKTSEATRRTTPLPHGTHNKYVREACRCEECRAAHAEMARRWRAKAH